MYAGTPENFVGKRDGERSRLLQLSDMVFRARFAGLQLPFSLRSHVCRKTTVSRQPWPLLGLGHCRKNRGSCVHPLYRTI